jgi:hypothetical protein
MVGSSLAIASVVVVVIVLEHVRDSRRRRSNAGALSPAPRAAGTTAATRATVTTGAAFPATAGAAGSAEETVEAAAPNRAQLRTPGVFPGSIAPASGPPCRRGRPRRRPALRAGCQAETDVNEERTIVYGTAPGEWRGGGSMMPGCVGLRERRGLRAGHAGLCCLVQFTVSHRSAPGSP